MRHTKTIKNMNMIIANGLINLTANLSCFVAVRLQAFRFYVAVAYVLSWMFLGASIGFCQTDQAPLSKDDLGHPFFHDEEGKQPIKNWPQAKKDQLRAQELMGALRCPVCQNQSILESNATLAVDLRRIITEQINQGTSNDDIKQYLVDRYGDFILLKPPFKATTLLLWLLPFIILGVGALMVWRLVVDSKKRYDEAILRGEIGFEDTQSSHDPAKNDHLTQKAQICDEQNALNNKDKKAHR
ncbi:MAG: cytochrome c-type biogenesis protein [Pseudomonadota bacterium]